MSQAGIFATAMTPPGVVVQTIQGNSGGPVSPNGANNIFVVGDGTTILTAGNPGTNTITISSTGVLYNYVNVNTTPYVVLSTDDYISVDCSVMAITIQLPDVPLIGIPYIIKDRTGSANANFITVTTVSGVVIIEDATTYVMDSAFQCVSLIGNGTSYEIY